MSEHTIGASAAVKSVSALSNSLFIIGYTTQKRIAAFTVGSCKRPRMLLYYVSTAMTIAT